MILLENIYPSEMVKTIQAQDGAEFELRQNFANLLGHIYRRVDWGTIASGKALAPDIFQHRLFFAAKEDNVEMFLEQICSKLSIQSTLIPVELVLNIQQNENHMNFLRERTRIFTAYAMKLSKELKIQRLNQIKQSKKDELDE